MLEAILFASGESVHIKLLAEAVGDSIPNTMLLLEEMQKRYIVEHHGIRLNRYNDKWQLSTKPEYHDAVLSVLGLTQGSGLSRAAIETLAIIAYKQPVTRLVIEQIRGVSSGSSIRILLDKDLIAEAGRLDAPGRPFLYKTTDVFLKSVGLSSLAALPDYSEFSAMVLSAEQENE